MNKRIVIAVAIITGTITITSARATTKDAKSFVADIRAANRTRAVVEELAKEGEFCAQYGHKWHLHSDGIVSCAVCEQVFVRQPEKPDEESKKPEAKPCKKCEYQLIGGRLKCLHCGKLFVREQKGKQNR